MKILSVKATNFGSYDHFEMDLSGVGLALICGKTGSGKSTIMDMVCWGLYGTTSKEGAADDVKSWINPDQRVYVKVQCGQTTVTRIRGTPTQHDLYFEDGERIVRGKDLRDTQRLLDAHLGVCASLFLSASYFSEFNATAQFFLASAKDRRLALAKIAPLQFPNNLSEKITNAKKEAKKTNAERLREFDRNNGTVIELTASLRRTTKAASEFAAESLERIRSLRLKKETFKEEKEKRCKALQERISKESVRKRRLCVGPGEMEKITQEIQDLEDKTCIECGQKTSNARRLSLQSTLNDRQRAQQTQKHIDDTFKSLKTQLEAEEATINQYGDLLALEEAKANPFTSQTHEVALQLMNAETKAGTLKEQLEALEKRLNALEQLYDLCGTMRGLLVTSAVKECQDNVNKLLSKTFDSEFQVAFTIVGEDLEVGITKNGYRASYRQLSRGQRRLLSLTFSVSVMEMAANAAGVHMDFMAFDEATDGMDDAMKVKAHQLYEDLASRHSTVLVIDHSAAAQEMFTKKFRVELEGDYSRVYEE